ncbi:hypothetical protein ALC53_11614, partial [Atta colombica]
LGNFCNITYPDTMKIAHAQFDFPLYNVTLAFIVSGYTVLQKFPYEGGGGNQTQTPIPEFPSAPLARNEHSRFAPRNFVDFIISRHTARP